MPIPLHVLILEVRPADAMLMVDELRRAGFDPVWQRVETEAEYLYALDSGLDVILADYTLPQFNAVRALRSLQKRGLDIPFVIVTGSIGEEVAVDAIKRGAADYLLKDRLSRLGPAVANALEQKRFRDKKHAADLALSQSEERFRAITQSANEAIIVADSHGKIILWNKGAEKIFQYPEQEALGQPISILMPELYLTLHRKGVQRFHATGESRVIGKTYEGRGVRKDGSEFPVEISLAAWETVNGKFFSTIIRDISERKRAEERLAKLNNCLLSFGSDPNENINHLVAFLGEQLGATCALYNRLEDNQLHSLGQWNTPSGFNAVDKPDGHICYDVIRSGRDDVRLIRDLLETSYAQTDPNVVRYGLRTYFGKAVSLEGTYVGSLCVVYQEDRVPSQDDVNLLGIVASAVGVEEKRKRAEEEVRRRANEFAILYETTRDLATQRNLPTVLQIIVERTVMLLASTTVIIALYDPQRQDLELVAEQGSPLPLGTRIPLGSGLGGFVAQTRQPFVVNDYAHWEHRLPQLVENSIVAEAAVPMIYGGELIGVLLVAETTARTFTEKDTRLLSLFAGQAASAVRNARLFAQATHRAEQLAVLNAAAIQIQQHLEPDEIIRAACDQLQSVGTFASIFLMSDKGEAQHIHTSMSQAMLREYVALFGEKRVEFSFPTALIQDVWEGLQAGETILTSDLPARLVAAMPPSVRPVGEWMQAHSPQSAMLVAPLTRGGATIGMLTQVGDQVGDADTPVFALFARQVSVSLENARLFDETRRRANELQVVAQVSSALRTASTRAEMLPVILDQLLALLHADGAALAMRDPASGDTVVELARGEFTKGLRPRIAPGEGVSGTVIASGKPFVTSDIRKKTGIAKPDAFETVRAVACVPLIVQDQIIGAMWVRRQSEISAGEVRLLTAIADIAANAIHRTTLHEQTERAVADLAIAYETTLDGWSRALDLRDKETEGHTQRVTEMTVRLAREMGIGEADLAYIRRGALLHDIGKMGVPDRILLKPGGFDEVERKIMRQHPEFAYQLLSPIAYLRPALDIPYCHHEKWDGTGYPRGLKGEEIPLAARLFAVVDVWDALRSDRPYRGAWAEDKVREHIRAGSGSHFDPKVAEAFLKMVEVE